MLSDDEPEQPASTNPDTRSAATMRWLMTEAPANERSRARIIAQV
jgi:hypothetical protein